MCLVQVEIVGRGKRRSFWLLLFVVVGARCRGFEKAISLGRTAGN